MTRPGIPVRASRRGTCLAGTRVHCVTADGTRPRWAATRSRATGHTQNLQERRVVFWHDRKLCRNSTYSQPAIFYMADNLHSAEDAAVSETLHRAQVARRLRAAIEALGVTQAEVARAFEVSPSKLGNWVRANNYPSEWFVKRFCDRYGITTDWIYRGIVSGMAGELADALYRSEQEASQRETAPEIRSQTPHRTVPGAREQDAKAVTTRVIRKSRT